MSELIDTRDSRAVIRRQLLATASAFALAAYIASTNIAKAEDADRPTVWIELGGQMEFTQGATTAFTAPFMTITPTPDVYQGVSFIGSQGPAREAFGGEGKISFQPEDSDWVFSAAVRYGRANASRHAHNQIAHPNVPFSFSYYGKNYHYTKYVRSAALADTQTQTSERHLILDFTAGRDVGLGMFGRGGMSTINAGIRIASFTADSSAYMTARPTINIKIEAAYGGIVPLPHGTFYQHTLSASAARSFSGIGPSLSWNATADLLGDAQRAELVLDWGINGAILFGRQKAKTSHSTRAYHYSLTRYANKTPYPLVYHHSNHSTRSRLAVVPNAGGFAGLSVKYSNAKVSFGYRADFFFGAMDAGIDAHRNKDLGFHGPFATISIGFGG